MATTHAQSCRCPSFLSHKHAASSRSRPSLLPHRQLRRSAAGDGDGRLHGGAAASLPRRGLTHGGQGGAAVQKQKKKRIPMVRVCCAADDQEEVNDLGVNVALSMLNFYKREISPLLPSSCRYVPTCSEYSMQAYKRYGVAKGTILTAWRLCRCNPLGGHGYDPPRWFGEELTEQ